MDFREKLTHIWEGVGEEVVWQPRLEYWYQANRNRDTLPPEYQDKDLFEIYDDLDASVRYYGPYHGGTGFSGFLDFDYDNVKIEETPQWENEGSHNNLTNVSDVN